MKKKSEMRDVNKNVRDFLFLNLKNHSLCGRIWILSLSDFWLKKEYEKSMEKLWNKRGELETWFSHFESGEFVSLLVSIFYSLSLYRVSQKKIKYFISLSHKSNFY